MFKFIMNKGQQSSMEESRSQEDFYAFSKISTFGFPYKPSALAWDPTLCLMAIGTQNGSLRIYGASGVQFSGEMRNKCSIIILIFVSKKGRLISLCSDNSLHLWELNEVGDKWDLSIVKSFTLEGQMKKITSIFLNSNSTILYMGTICGNIYTLNVASFEMGESVIYQDVIIQNIPDDSKLNQGAVKTILEQPNNPDCLLIGYHQGLIVLWNIRTISVVGTFVGSQSLESVSWHHRGSQFMSSHSDGSYVIWNIDNPLKPAEVPITPYGPFACKAINKVIWESVKGGDDYIIFSGGMPRSGHGEKNTVAVMCGDMHQVFDLTSKVVDFFTISDVFDESDFDNPHSLIILLEEELIAIDLESDNWLPFRLPYLDCPHSSPITCVNYCANVHKDLWKQLVNISQLGAAENFSENAWPIHGGKSLLETPASNLLVTGHEDGSVKLWGISPVSMQLLYTFHTSNIFVTGEHNADIEEEGELWPPFCKIGNFETFSDDSRLAIRKLVLNDITRTLIVGGSAGQVLVLQWIEMASEKETKVSLAHLVTDYDNLTWNGQPPLSVRSGNRKFEKGFHLQCLIQVIPPAAVTALAFHAEWNLLAIGTFHGFLVFDIIQKKCIVSKCTLSTGVDVPVSSGELSPRSKSLKNSLRESFRKLRKGKPQKARKERTGSLSSDLQKYGSKESSIHQRDSIASSPVPTTASSPSPELRSFDGDMESYHTEDMLGSVVQSVYFAQSFIINNVITTPTFWAGTNKGNIFIFTITMPNPDVRTSEAVICQLGKEIQLRHQAPVLGIQIVDHRGYPLPDPLDIQYQRTKPADLSGSHRVVVCTEEQIKIFTLPSMKPFCKYKVTATEDCHIYRVGFSAFQSKSDPKSSENCVVCLTNYGGINIYSIPDLKKQVSYRRSFLEDMYILTSVMFTSDGHLIHLNSLSEFETTSLSASTTQKAVCKIELPEDARVDPQPASDVVLNVHNICLEADSRINGVLSEENEEEPGEAQDEHQQVSNSIGSDSTQSALSPAIVNGNSAPGSSEQLSADASPLFQDRASEDSESQQTPGHSVSTASLNQVRLAPIAQLDEFSSSDDIHPHSSDSSSRRSNYGLR